MKFLISFCNAAAFGNLANQYILGVYDWEKHDLKYVALPFNKSQNFHPVQGSTGLIRNETQYFVVTQSKTPQLFCLDSDFNVIDSKLLELVKDPHSLALHESCIYIVSTGDNSIVRVPFDQTFGNEEVYWKFDDTSVDKIHVNSIAFWGGDLIVSCFGNPVSSNVIRSGFIKNVSSDVMLIEGIREPHNLICYNDYLYVLESITGCLYKISPTYDIELIKEFIGYARGLALFEDEVFIVRNARRKLSRQLGGKKHIPLADTTANICEWKHSWICRSKLGEETYKKKNFTAFAFEIYDIVPLISLPSDVNLVNEVINQRILDYEEICANMQQQLKVLHEAKAESKNEIVKMKSQLDETQSELEHTKSQLHQAWEELNRTKLMLPQTQEQPELSNS